MAYLLSYIPSTQDGYTLQPNDEITHRVHESEAMTDAHELLGNLDPSDIDLDDIVQWTECEGMSETYISTLVDVLSE